MTLTIDIPDELGETLRQQASLAGVSLEALVRETLRERAEPASVPDEPDPIAEAYARLPRRAPEDIAEMARQQGVEPLQWEKVFGMGAEFWPEDDMDEFLETLREWRREGRPKSAP